MIFILILFLNYFALMVFLHRGLGKMKSKVIPAGSSLPKVSIIVPAHNEEEGLKATLTSLTKQNYQGDFEIICIDDRSTDQTRSILEEFATAHPIVRPVFIHPSEGSITGNKKRAMQRGIEQSTGDIILSIDGDCLAPSSWVASMASNFTEEVDIVQGPKRIIPQNSLVNGYQQLETLGFTLIEGAFFSQNLPMLASAPSLAYRKDIFFQSGGFNRLMEVESGDDDMLVHQMADIAREVRYNSDPEVQVATQGVGTWKQLFNQHARWASNGSSYSNRTYVLFLILLFAFFVWLGIAPFFHFFGLPSISWWLPLLLKALLDWSFISRGALILNSQKLLRFFPLVFFVQIYVILYAVPAGRWKWYKW